MDILTKYDTRPAGAYNAPVSSTRKMNLSALIDLIKAIINRILGRVPLNLTPTQVLKKQPQTQPTPTQVLKKQPQTQPTPTLISLRARKQEQWRGHADIVRAQVRAYKGRRHQNVQQRVRAVPQTTQPAAATPRHEDGTGDLNHVTLAIREGRISRADQPRVASAQRKCPVYTELTHNEKLKLIKRFAVQMLYGNRYLRAQTEAKFGLLTANDPSNPANPQGHHVTIEVVDEEDNRYLSKS